MNSGHHPVSKRPLRLTITQPCSASATTIAKLFVGFIITLTLGLGLVFGAVAAPSYVRLQLPQQLSVELPRNWIVFSDSQRITLDAWVAAKSEKITGEPSAAELGFAANLYDDKGRTVGIFNVRYYPAQSLTQRDAVAASKEDTQELDAALKASFAPGVEGAGNRVLEWNGTRKTVLNGMTVFISEYRRTSPQGIPFRARLVRMLDGPRSFTVTVSYREDQKYFMAAISNRIVESMRR